MHPSAGRASQQRPSPIYIDSSRLPRPTRAPAAPPKAGANADDKAMGIAVIDGDIGPGDPNERTTQTFTGDIGLRGAMASCRLPSSLQRLVSDDDEWILFTERQRAKS